MVHPRVEDLRESWMESVVQTEDEDWAEDIFERYEEEVLALLRLLKESQADHTIGNFDNPLEKLDMSRYSKLITESPIPLDRITAFKLELDAAVAQELQKLSEDELADIYQEAQSSKEGKVAQEKTEQLHEEFTEYLGEPVAEDVTQDQFVTSVKSGRMAQQAEMERDVFLQQIQDYGTTTEDDGFVYPDPGKSYLMDAREFLILLQKDEEYSNKDALDAIENSSLVTINQNADDELNLDNAVVAFSIKSMEIPDHGPLKLLNRFLIEGRFSVYIIDEDTATQEVSSEEFTAGEGVLRKSEIISSEYNPMTTNYIVEVLEEADW